MPSNKRTAWVQHHWTGADEDILRSMWKHYTARIIAKRVGVTRNAVIGKAHRLGLSAKKRGRRHLV